MGVLFVSPTSKMLGRTSSFDPFLIYMPMQYLAEGRRQARIARPFGPVRVEDGTKLNDFMVFKKLWRWLSLPLAPSALHLRHHPIGQCEAPEGMGNCSP